MDKVVVMQPIAEEGVSMLEDAGFRVVVLPNLEPRLVEKELADADGLLVRNAQVTGAMLEKAPRLKVVGRHGVGVDTIDVAAATRLGIWVVNTPQANSASVAEHVVMMILALAKNVTAMDSGIRSGDFDIRHRLYGEELEGKTLSIVGLGRIGSSVARKAHYGLGMRIIAYDPFAKAEQVDPSIELTSDWNRLFGEADFVSLNLPLTPETRLSIGDREFSRMKETAYLINCARAELVDHGALCEALKSGKIRGAGIDVYDSDPPAAEDPILAAPRTILTPHSAAHTRKAMLNMATHAAQGIIEILSRRRPAWPVNHPETPRMG